MNGHPHAAQIHGVNAGAHGCLNGYAPTLDARFTSGPSNHEENGGRHEAPHHQKGERPGVLRAIASNDEPGAPEKDKERGREPLQGRRSH